MGDCYDRHKKRDLFKQRWRILLKEEALKLSLQAMQNIHGKGFI